MLGQALDLLDTFGPAVRDNTIVVFHSDHGYQLGELNEWSKKTTTELATRVPLMVRAPWKTASVGARTGVRAELVDLYRTLVDLAELDASTLQADIQGESLAPLFDAPAAPPPSLSSKSGFSQIGSCACRVYGPKGANNWTGMECDAGRCVRTNVSDFDFMGYSMISPDGWRGTLWAPMNNVTERVDFSKPTYFELYNQSGDTGADFDYDAYFYNVAQDAVNADRVAAMRTSIINAVESWY